MSAEENKAIVRTMLDALDREDWAAIEVHPGLYETRQHHPMVRATFPDLHHTIEQEMVDGDLVAIRAIAHGTHLGDFLGIAPTGKPTAFQVLLMDRIVDGKIVEHWANADLASIMRQLGMFPPIRP